MIARALVGLHTPAVLALSAFIALLLAGIVGLVSACISFGERLYRAHQRRSAAAHRYALHAVCVPFRKVQR